MVGVIDNKLFRNRFRSEERCVLPDRIAAAPQHRSGLNERGTWWLLQFPIGIEEQGFPGLVVIGLGGVGDWRSRGIEAFEIELDQFRRYLKPNEGGHRVISWNRPNRMTTGPHDRNTAIS